MQRREYGCIKWGWGPPAARDAVPGPCKGLRPLTRFGVFVGGFLAGVTGRDRRPVTHSCGIAMWSCAPAVQSTADHGCTSVQRGGRNLLHLVVCALARICERSSQSSRVARACLSFWCSGRRPPPAVGYGSNNFYVVVVVNLPDGTEFGVDENLDVKSLRHSFVGNGTGFCMFRNGRITPPRPPRAARRCGRRSGRRRFRPASPASSGSP